MSPSLPEIYPDVMCYSIFAKYINARGRPSGCLTTYVKRNLRSSIFDECDNFLALCLEVYVVVNIYLPKDYRNDQSECLFAKNCDLLAACLDKLWCRKILCIIVGYFNCNLCAEDSAPCVSLLLSLSDGWFDVLAKDFDFSYIDASYFTSTFRKTTPVSVLSEYQVSDNLTISGSLHVPFYRRDSPGSYSDLHK
jgi:hypothetical protein